MFTLKAFAVVEVHERLAVPVPFAARETVAEGLNGWHVKPVGTVSSRATEPTKLNVLVRVIVEEIDDPTAPLGDEALIEKSPTWTVAGAERDAVPGEPAPLTPTAKVPAIVELNEQDEVTVAFAVIATAVAGQTTVRPAGAVPMKVILPAKLNVLVRETLTDTPVCPTFRS